MILVSANRPGRATEVPQAPELKDPFTAIVSGIRMYFKQYDRAQNKFFSLFRVPPYFQNQRLISSLLFLAVFLQTLQPRRAALYIVSPL